MISRSTAVWVLALGAACVAPGAAAAAPAPGKLVQEGSLPSVQSGQRPGPDILYSAPPAQAPQLENAGPWLAEPILVSGAMAYRSGEFLYQDFLYDDHGAAGAADPEDPFTSSDFLFSPKAGTLTYPADPEFADNAADLVELRVTSVPGATAFRVTLNTLIDPARTAFTIALGNSPAPVDWPHGAGVRSPAELFLTVHGDQAELRDAAGGPLRQPAPRVELDERRRQVDVRVPHAAWNPGTGTVRMAAGVGLWDVTAPGGGRYLAPAASRSTSVPGGAAPGAPALFNVAFRTDEPLPDVSNAFAGVTIGDSAAGAKVDATWWRERAQAAALAAGDISSFSAQVDFAKLGAKVRRLRARRRFRACRGRCRRRVSVRLPRRSGLSITRAVVRHRGRVVRFTRGRDLRRVSVRRPTRGAFTLRLRLTARGSDRPDDNSGVPKTGPISRILVSRYSFGQGVDYAKLCGGIEGGSAPCDGFHVGQLQPYGLYVPRGPRPARGFGFTLLLHSLSANYNQYMASKNQSQLGERGAGSIVATPSGRGPDGFYYDIAEADTFEVWADVARRYKLDPDWTVVSGYSMGGIGTYRLLSRWPDLFARGMSTVGLPDESARLPALRNTPIMAWAASLDELVNIAFTERAVSDMQSNGLRFEADLFEAADHLTLATNDEYGPAAAFLGEHRVDRNPPHVTYVVEPGSDSKRALAVADHAYWISGVRIRDPEASPVGTIDARSEAFGLGDPEPRQGPSANRTLEGGARGPMPYFHRQQDWGPAPSTPKADRLVVRATNVAAATVDARRARLSCSPVLDVQSDGPFDLRVACAPEPASCAGALRVRLPRLRGAGRRRATVSYRGKVVRRARGGRKLRLLTLRRPSAGAFRLRVRVTAGGRSVTVVRRFRACAGGPPG